MSFLDVHLCQLINCTMLLLSFNVAHCGRTYNTNSWKLTYSSISVYHFLPHSHAHHTPMPIVLPRSHVSPAHQDTTVVTQPPFLFPLPAPTPALIFVLLGLHVVMAALSNHAPRGNTHLKGSGHARHVQMGSAVPIHLDLRSPPSQLPPPLPLTVLQKLNPRVRVQNHICANIFQAIRLQIKKEIVPFNKINK